MSLHVNPASELIREPDLLLPGRKPVGPVKVDWSNPMARQLYMGLLFNEHSRNAYTIGQAVPLLVSPIPAYKGAPWGLAAEFDEELISVPLNENIFNSGETPEFTMVLHWKIPARVNAYHYAITFLASAQNARKMRVGYRGFGDTQRRHSYAQTQWSSSATTFDRVTNANFLDQNREVVVVYSVRAGLQFLYSHVLGPSGNDVFEDNFSDLGSFTHNIDTLQIGNTSDSRYLKSYLYSFYLFRNRAFNEQEARDLARDPYQVLIPA